MLPTGITSDLRFGPLNAVRDGVVDALGSAAAAAEAALGRVSASLGVPDVDSPAAGGLGSTAPSWLPQVTSWVPEGEPEDPPAMSTTTKVSTGGLFTLALVGGLTVLGIYGIRKLKR